MASILRSSKFVRYFAGLARSIVFNSHRGEVDGTLIQRNQCLTNDLARFLATQVVPSRNQNDSNLERSLRRLDQDVRRTGRISRRELEDVLEELRLTRSATSTQSLLIIRCCGSLIPEASPAIRTKLVEEIWKTLEKIGVPMDVSHYNALLRVYLENEHPFSPTEFLANMERKGVEPNRVTYQRLISRYCQQADIEGATRILEFMREKQLPVNENVFNALIMGHSQADDMESAAGILGVMKQAGLEPSADTYTTLICGYAKKGDIEAIKSTLEECDKKDIHFIDKDYMDMILSLAVNNHEEHVDVIMNRLRQTAGYNQDAINLILRLVNHGQEDLGYKILLTMPRPSRADGEQTLVGVFFVRQLVQANRPIEKIIALCDTLVKEELNPRAFHVAAESSIHSGNVDQACALLLAMKERNLPVRPHYFWPLLATHSKNTDTVLDILTRMSTVFQLSLGGETLKDYVIPSLSQKPPEEIVFMLKNTGITIAAIANALVHHYLNINAIDKAAHVASRYRAHYPASLLRRPLVQAYINSEDTGSFISILRQIHDSVDRAFSPDEEPSTTIPDRTELVGFIVLDVARDHKNRVTRIEAILQGLLEQGLGLSNSTAEQLQDRLGEGMTSEISTLLGKLTTGDLIPTTLTRPGATQQVIMDEGQLLRIQKIIEEKGESTRGVKRQLFNLYCRNKDLENVQKIMQELEADSFVFTGGMYAQLIDLYTHLELLEDVMSTIKIMREKEPDFLLDGLKIVRAAGLMVNNDKIPDALKFLNEQPKEGKLDERTYVYGAACWRLLNSLAEKGEVDQLKQVFDTLVQREYIEVNNVLLGPLIKVHLVRNDVAAALKEFEMCCQKYRATPWKNELACKMIEAEDAASLQMLTDLSTQVHGEVNSLYDLVFAFVECGRIRQARKILETPGLRNRPQRLNFICERYQQEGMVAPLEGLVEATRDISHIDRSDIYYHLLVSYCKSKDTEKALGLWTKMQEEDVQASDAFLVALGNFLKQEGQEVPFVIPVIVDKPKDTDVRRGGREIPASQENSALQQFRMALRRNYVDEALQIKERMDNADTIISITDMSLLIETLVKADRFGEASKLTLGMLEKNIHPVPRIFRFLLSRLSSAGDADTISDIGSHLSPELKKLVSLDNRICHAYVASGQASEYLKTLSREIDEANETDLEQLSEKFPRGGAIGLLIENPELQPEYEQLALKYASRGILAPINVLWTHLFVEGKDAEAKKLWDEHLVGSPRIMFQHILQQARERKDENIPRKLITHLQSTPVSEGATGNAYSCLVDVLVSNGNIDEALLVLKDAVKDVCLENMNRTALLRLQASVENQGKSFPYEVPSKNAKSSTSSSSSSDDEPNAKSSTSSSSSSDDEPTKK